MPRVNRDLQRRMAARRERERQRPAERRYSFATPEPALEAEDAGLLEEDGAVAETAQEQKQTQARPVRAAAAPAANRAGARSTTKPFSAYRDEYAYVYGDLRRVAAVIGGLLVALIVLYFVLPLLAH